MGPMSAVNSLIAEMAKFEIIDCHEHLGPEKGRVEQPVDVFTLFSHYTGGDLRVAGMSGEDYNSLFDRGIPIEKRWAAFEPYLEQIRWGSYARAALLAARKFYGFGDINRETYRPLSEAMQQANEPGIYERVLGDTCRIRTALTQCGSTDLGSPLLTPVMPLAYEMETWEALSRPSFAPEATIRSLDDYILSV